MTDLTQQQSSSSNNNNTATSPSNYFQISSNFRRRSSASNLSPRNQQSSFELFTSPQIQQQQQFNVPANRNSMSLFLIPPPSLSQLSNSKFAAATTTTSPMFEMINSFTLTTVFSQMIVYGNSLMIEERPTVSTMVSSFVSNTNSELKLPISVLEISNLYSILLVVIKNMQDSHKKIIELVEWQKSLRQLGVVPILVLQNTKQELDEFLEGNQWNGYSIDVNNMMRVSDLNFELTKQLFENTNSPLSNEQQIDREIVESKMFLIRNGSIVWESSTKPEDQVIGTILSTVVLKLPWYAMSTDEISSDESQHALQPLSTVNNSLNNLNQSYKSSCSLSSGGLRNSIRFENGATSPSNSSTSVGGISASIRIGSLVNDHNSFIVPAGLSLHGAMSVLHTISNNNFGNSEDEVSCEDDFQFPENQNHLQMVQLPSDNNFEFTQAKSNSQPTPVDQNNKELILITDENEISFTPKATPTPSSQLLFHKEQSFTSTNTNNTTTSSDKMTASTHHTIGTPLLGADSRYCSSIASMNSTLIETSASSLDLTTLMMPPSPNSISTTTSASPASAETLIQNRKLSIFQKLRGRNDIEKIASEQQKLEKEMQIVKKKEIVSRSQNNLYAEQSIATRENVTSGRRSIFSYCFGSKSSQPATTSEKTLVMYDPVESHLSEMYQVMHDDMKRQYFKLFSLKQFNAENLLFWEDVKLFYKKIVVELKRQHVTKQRFSLKSSQIDVSQTPILSNVNISKESIIELHDKIMKMAKYIAEKYLYEKDSVYCLNTSNKMIEQVSSRMTLEGLEFINISENIFDDVVMEIIKTVLPDMFCRFVLSNEYEEMQRVLQVSNNLF
ncbi:predicted protein [Naegleria gruberi]|uniref:Predicted protein n=1 Tax=Naegleria gruberi TaxID=5762 RepID=D2VF72_NAEGR|nr:uncharacterized protein NAEGRDRAFT_58014 [Naegleria gruberi]EFC44634.1 predicted protein [Naegleria gruberi]|eukprot:XP_002677378.1 predicted protein [Naegleria gruberi strain NEG-M]